ncbi:MAG: type I secretion system permease/ATPase [Parasphingopyxis sp.]|uniref:type I secretion system permease/ATPase n=1 Tax=Parasphingopyxis sp. TaxID=1920299 RepID=UPI003FA00095
MNNNISSGAGSDSGLACLILMASLLNVPADPSQLVHERGRGDDRFTVQDILRSAKRLKINANVKRVALDELIRQPLPAISQAVDGRFFILGRVEETDAGLSALVQFPGDGSPPEKIDENQLAEIYFGELIFMTTRESVAGAIRKFDIAWFIPALVKYRRSLRDVLIASFMIQIVALATPIFFQLVIDKVLVHQSLTTLNILAIGFVVVSIWDVVLSGLRTWMFGHTANRVDTELGSQLFRHLMNLPLSYFESRRVGDSVARVRELDTIRDFLTNSSVTLVIDFFFTFVFLFVLYIYSPFLTLIVVISLPIYIAISVIITPPLRRRLEEKFQRVAENQAFLVESVTGVQTLKSMAVEPQMRQRWERQLAGYNKVGFDVVRLSNWGSQSVQLVSKLTTVAILYFGAQAVIAGELSVGALVAFNMLAGRVAEPVLRVAQMWQDFQQVRVSVDRLGDVLNAPPEPEHDPSKASLPAIRGEIVWDKVRFRYRPDGPEALRGIDLKVEPGEMLGIVGPSGSGKSTLTKLVQRLYVPEQGRVLVDGFDLALVDPAWLRRQVGVVLQENLLFNRSLRDNIALSAPTIPLEKVIEAATLAGAHDFIAELQEGYDTEIDERGGNLSGGQRQRIAIARALITDPKILILDEATSALDAESEEVIQANLKKIAADRTVIIIAHRLSAVRQCNRIVTVEQGAITEMGSHDELLAANGRYADLYRRQMGAMR